MNAALLEEINEPLIHFFAKGVLVLDILACILRKDVDE